MADEQQSILASIERLQEVEKQLFSQLEQSLARGDGDAKTDQALAKKIDELANIRQQLFNELGTIYATKQNMLNSERESIANQMALANVIEDELLRTRQNIGSLESNKQNKRRLVELGRWESDRYAAHIGILRRIAVGFTLVLVVSLLLKQGILPQNVATILIIGILSVLIINVLINVYDLSQRNEFDYGKYNFQYDKNAVTSFDQDSIVNENIEPVTNKC